jgi:cobalt-zinc-cadmium efflux system membrane fusion protein
VRPRFAGLVHVLRKQVGELVAKGETVALVQSNESLADYEVTAGAAGRVVARGVSAGESVTPDTPLYTIVDLTDVWVEFPIYPHQLGVIRTGQRVHVKPESGDPALSADADIDYVGPVMAQDTRVSNARVTLPNRSLRWEPGMYVTVTVVTDHASVAVAVPDAGVVRTDEGPAVFVADRSGYRMQRVATGRTDGRLTEIVSGLAPGTTVVARNAFVLKAELLKSEEE